MFLVALVVTGFLLLEQLGHVGAVLANVAIGLANTAFVLSSELHPLTPVAIQRPE